jgi:serine/threonine protein kinase
MPLNTGILLNQRYRIVKLLGQGGFGAVYRAWDLNLKRAFALKENLDLSPESIRQFEREASFLADLHHPNLPRVIDYFLIAGQGQYLVMDYIEGETLEDKMKLAGGPLPESQVLSWIIQVCDALDFLHSQKPPVIHRDIKPANIKITPEGKAILVDFGIAKTQFGGMQTTLGARAVTEGYSPPEQYGHGVTDHRSDIYALGATLYHMITGVPPVESVQRYLGSSLPAPRNLNPSISPASEGAIIKAMDVEMANRFQSAGAFKTSLLTPKAAFQPAHVAGYEQSGGKKTQIAGPQKGKTRKQTIQERLTDKSQKWLLIGGIFGISICVLVIGLGALGGVFSFLKGTPTATESIISDDLNGVISTEETSTPLPVINATWTPSAVPPSPTLSPTMLPTATEVPPTYTSTPTAVLDEWHPCQDAYPSRLHVGDRAYVSYYPPFNNNVRTGPDLEADEVGFLEPGEKMKIVGGPGCEDFMVWWEIQSLETDVAGWTSEGDLDNYWLVPLD